MASKTIGGKHYFTTQPELAGFLKVGTDTISKYVKMTGAPTFGDNGWCAEEIRHFIRRQTPRADVAKRMSDPKDKDGPKKMSWKDRMERARAMTLEVKLEVERKQLIHQKLVHDFFAREIPGLVSDLRRLFEGDLPAKTEGKPAAEIREINRTHLDKILQDFEAKGREFSGELTPPDTSDDGETEGEEEDGQPESH